MTPGPGPAGARRRRPAWLALAVLALGCGATALALAWQARHNAEVADERFRAVARRLVTQLQARLALYEYGLRGARGAALAAGFEDLDRARFRVYSQSRDLDREFPGARGMGIIRRVAEADEARFVDAARHDGMPSFALRELSPHGGDRYVIQYIEPVERNLQAVGLDVASETNRRTAAETSMRTGRPTLSAPITLLQAQGKPLRSFLLLLPVYAPGADLSTPAARDRATLGWSYAPLVMDEVLAGFDLGGDLTLRLRDVGAQESGAFFESAGHARPAARDLTERRPLSIYGRVWEAELKATPEFVASLSLQNPGTVGATGLALSLLLAVLSALFAQSRERAAQVRAEQARRAAIVDCTPDAVIGETIDGIITDWNQGAVRLLGFEASEAIGRHVADLILPKGLESDDARLRAAVARGELVAAFDTTRLRADGRLVDVSVSAAPIVGPDGRLVGLSKTIRDITAAKLHAQEIAELNATLELQVEDRTALLEAARRDLRNILDAVPSLVSYWDRDLRNRFANRAYSSWFGWDPERMPGQSLRDLAGERFEISRARFEAALRGEPQVFSTVIALPNGTQRNVLANFLPDMVDGEARGFYMFVFDVTAQTQAQAKLEAALRDNEALLRTIHEHAIVSVTDRAGRITDVNRNFCDISGFSREELIGQTHAVVNSGQHEAAFWQRVWHTIASGKPWRGEVCNRRKDGSLYWVDSMIAPFTGADGTIERYISIRLDITAAKETEKRLQQTTSRIAMAADAAGIGIWEWDVTGNELTWDDWMYRLYGRPRSDAAQPYTLWSTSLHPDDRERAERELNAALVGERPFDTEFRIFGPDGEVRHLKASAQVVRDATGKAVRMTGVNFDISKRKRAELELIETSSLLQNVLESASEVAIIAGDPNLVLKVFNKGAERLLGYSAAEMVDKVTPAVFHDAAEVEARARELSEQSGESVVGGAAFVHPLALGRPREWTYVRKDGQRVTVSLVVTAMLGENGELFGYLGIAHDVTRQKQYEATLRDAMRAAEAASRAKSQFLANVSHEIRTPMNAVIGLSHLLSQTAVDAEQATLVDKIHVASRSLLALLNDVLDVSKIEAGELELERAPFDLEGLISDVSTLAELQATGKHIRFTLDTDPDLPAQLEGDVTRLRQILSNLLSNAVKFTNEGGVTLRVRKEVEHANHVRLRFEVEDSGIGIAPEVQSRLFQPFAQADASTTRRFGGTGLGLSIVRQLALRMDGEVGLSSTAGEGSTFWVTVPFGVARIASEAKVESDPPRLHALEGVRVLVVDDSEINLFVAQRILTQEGATVSLAQNGQQAIACLEADPAAFDIVLMDVQMPVMDGYLATSLIRERLGLRELRIVALTADARSSERERALRAGMNDFLSKPFEPADLLRCMVRWLPEASAAASTRLASPGGDGPEGWPHVYGIDAADVQARLYGDRALFRSLLQRLLREFAEVTRPQPLADEQAVLDYAAKMHRLRGSAGQLSARGLSELAGRIEGGLRSGDVQRCLPLIKRLGLEFTHLERSALASLSGEHPAQREVEDATPPEPQALSSLLELLRQQNLEAVEQARTLAAWGRKAWGEGAFEPFLEHVEGLRFQEAAELLERQLGTTGESELQSTVRATAPMGASGIGAESVRPPA